MVLADHPKTFYESPEAQEYWDIPVFAVSEQVKQNRVDARFIDHEKKKVLAVEMSCPWTENREKKQEEKTIKYGPLRWELKQQFPGYDIRQYNIIIDVLGGYEGTVRSSRRGDSTPDSESRHLTQLKHCQHTESDVLRIEQSELRHF